MKKPGKDSNKIKLNPIAERRRAKRIKLPVAIRYRLKIRAASFKHAACVDISGLGIGLVTKEPLTPGGTIDIVFSLAKERLPFYASCRVCWCKELGKNKFKGGIEFLKVKDHTRFIESLCEKMLSLV